MQPEEYRIDNCPLPIGVNRLFKGSDGVCTVCNKMWDVLRTMALVSVFPTMRARMMAMTGLTETMQQVASHHDNAYLSFGLRLPIVYVHKIFSMAEFSQ